MQASLQLIEAAMIDPSIRLGDLIPLIVYLLGAIAIVITMRNELKTLTQEVVRQGIRIDKLENIMIEQVRQDGRILMLEKLVEDMRHGRGYVQGRRIVDGEYSP